MKEKNAVEVFVLLNTSAFMMKYVTLNFLSELLTLLLGMDTPMFSLRDFIFKIDY